MDQLVAVDAGAAKGPRIIPPLSSDLTLMKVKRTPDEEATQIIPEEDSTGPKDTPVVVPQA